METGNFSLAYLAAELKPLVEGAFLNSVQQVKESTFKIKLHSKEHGSLELLATPNALYKTCFKMQAQQKQSGFAAFLKKQLYNKRILSLEQHGFDRIMEMRFADFDLVFELFARGNVILKDKAGKIVSCYTNEEWRDRKIRRGEQYIYPAAKPSATSLSEKEFEKTLKESGQDCVRAVVSALNVAPIAAEEACASSGIQKEKKSAALSEKEIKALFRALKEIYSANAKKPSPVVVEIAGTKQLLPYPFKSCRAEKETAFATLSGALDENVTKDVLQGEEKKASAEIGQKKARLLYSKCEQLKAKERLQKDMEECKKKAELIYMHYSGIKELVGAVKAGVAKGASPKDIMYKIKTAAEKGNKPAKLLLDFDPKTKRLVLDLPDS